MRIGVAEAISERVISRVHDIVDRLRRGGIPGVRDVIPAYTSILLTFEVTLVERDLIESAVRESLCAEGGQPALSPRRLEIPVCYDEAFAPDLAEVATHHACATAEVIRRHTEPVYTVAFIGFSPGFAYLTGLPVALHTPRLARPRTSVPAGSVAIGGKQTGIYPHATPGGWRIIGRTPLVMFDGDREEASLLKAGDVVRFVAVDRAEFDLLAREHGQ